MKVIILAGGFGTRLDEVTDSIPKPMVMIGSKPIIVHIMEIYASYGHTDFYLALGYKAEIIRKYFEDNKFNWNITMVDTGLKTMTGGRSKIMSKYQIAKPGQSCQENLYVLKCIMALNEKYDRAKTFTLMDLEKVFDTGALLYLLSEASVNYIKGKPYRHL